MITVFLLCRSCVGFYISDFSEGRNFLIYKKFNEISLYYLITNPLRIHIATKFVIVAQFDKILKFINS